MCKPPYFRFAFVRFILFRTFSAIFILDIRCGGTSGTMNSLFISWTSHPSEVLSEPPPLLESVAGRKYHYPPAFHRLLWLLSKGLNVILIARSTEVVAYGSCGCRDFIPAAGLTFSRCCYSVVKILRDLDRSFFPFTL